MFVYRLLTSFSTAKILKRTINNPAIKFDPDWKAMSTSPQQMRRLQKKIVAADESDMNELNPRMIDHLRASKPPCSTKLSSERESKREAGYVEDVSVASLSDQEPSNTQETVHCLI